MTKKILFISGSIGLGHVVRDLEIAKELRNQISDLEIIWLAGEPALSFLTGKGETIHPENKRWNADTNLLESINSTSTKKGKIFYTNLIEFFIKTRNFWTDNTRLLDEILEKERYDLLLGDETFEISLALIHKAIRIKPIFAMIFDFIGVDATTKNLIEKIIVYKINYDWTRISKKFPPSVITRIFIGELDDVPDKRFGLLLPNRKESVKNNYNFVGYILPFNPENYMLKDEIRKKLKLNSAPLIVCSIGGTSIGLPLLELCCKTFPLLKKKIPGAKMILVAGPRISAGDLAAPEGIILKEFLPNLYEYFAACDLAIVQGGSTTTLELVALKKPFIYFPVEGHFEQQLHVSPRLERLNAGVKMKFSETTPTILAEKIYSNVYRQVNYQSIPFDGAKNSVKIIREIIGN